MPTGYTASLYDGKEIEFKDFAMNCARAFGALVSMRDDPSGAIIPEELKPSEYHKDRLDKARKDLREFLNNPLSDDEILKIIDKNYKLSIEDNNRIIKEKTELKKRYSYMLDEVNNWEEPSEDHLTFKKFMKDQLEESIKFDCDLEYYNRKNINKPTIKEWRDTELSSLTESVAYHLKEWNAEVKRTNERNMWLKQLRDSL